MVGRSGSGIGGWDLWLDWWSKVGLGPHSSEGGALAQSEVP